MFALDNRLESDTIFIKDLAFSRLLLMNDARYLWVILVPRTKDAVEWHDLGQENAARLHQETMETAKIIKSNFAIEKINIGALGNIVSQLHVHIIGRNQNDAAWPAPVWGNGSAIKYENDEIIDKLKRLF